MDIIELAIASGMQVTLDARIGTQEYSSVHGSLHALRRFAEAVVVTVPFVARRQVPTEAEAPVDSSNTQGREVCNDC
jgi:hypothetical protein